MSAEYASATRTRSHRRGARDNYTTQDSTTPTSPYSAGMERLDEARGERKERDAGGGICSVADSSWSTTGFSVFHGQLFNQMVCALRFYFQEVTRCNWPIDRIPFCSEDVKQLPCVLGAEEVARLLDAARHDPQAPHRLSTLYGTGEAVCGRGELVESFGFQHR